MSWLLRTDVHCAGWPASRLDFIVHMHKGLTRAIHALPTSARSRLTKLFCAFLMVENRNMNRNQVTTFIIWNAMDSLYSFNSSTLQCDPWTPDSVMTRAITGFPFNSLTSLCLPSYPSTLTTVPLFISDFNHMRELYRKIWIWPQYINMCSFWEHLSNQSLHRDVSSLDKYNSELIQTYATNSQCCSAKPRWKNISLNTLQLADLVDKSNFSNTSTRIYCILRMK